MGQGELVLGLEGQVEQGQARWKVGNSRQEEEGDESPEAGVKQGVRSDCGGRVWGGGELGFWSFPAS